MLTENEKKLIKRITVDGWSYDGNSLDYSKTWEEQTIDFASYMNVVLLKDYTSAFGWNKEFAKGVLGSLVKKGVISVEKDGDETWVYVDETQFYQIKKELEQ